MLEPGDSRLDDYRHLADGDRLRAKGLFVAEGRLVVRRVLDDPSCRVRSLLLTDAVRASLEDTLERAPADLPAYIVSLEAM